MKIEAAYLLVNFNSVYILEPKGWKHYTNLMQGVIQNIEVGKCYKFIGNSEELKIKIIKVTATEYKKVKRNFMNSIVEAERISDLELLNELKDLQSKWTCPN